MQDQMKQYVSQVDGVLNQKNGDKHIFILDVVHDISEVIEIDTPGLTSPRLAGFGFTGVRRPIFPLDVEMLGITELKSMEEE